MAVITGGTPNKTRKAAQVAVKEMMAQLQPWIEQEKVRHIKRAVKQVTALITAKNSGLDD